MSENPEQIIIDALSKAVSPFLIYLFGSYVKRTEHPDSDIDIAFLSKNKKLDKYELFLLAQEIASKLNRDVDLIDLNVASTVFQAQVISTGKVIYNMDNRERSQFEMKIFKMYAKLNEERAPIIEKINESGTIHL